MVLDIFMRMWITCEEDLKIGSLSEENPCQQNFQCKVLFTGTSSFNTNWIFDSLGLADTPTEVNFLFLYKFISTEVHKKIQFNWVVEMVKWRMSFGGGLGTKKVTSSCWARVWSPQKKAEMSSPGEIGSELEFCYIR